MLLTIAIISLSVGAFLDGWSTNRAIRKGAHETDKLVSFLFGSTVPTPATVYFRGGAIIALESAILLAAAHFSHSAGQVLGIALIGQALIHLYEVYRTWKSFS
jgi:hypothetical protein